MRLTVIEITTNTSAVSYASGAEVPMSVDVTAVQGDTRLTYQCSVGDAPAIGDAILISPIPDSWHQATT